MLLNSGYREKHECEVGFNLEVQSQLELRFSPAAAQLILMNVCFVDYFFSISCYLSWISDSLLSGFKLSYLWVATHMKSRKACVKLQKFSIATVVCIPSARAHVYNMLYQNDWSNNDNEEHYFEYENMTITDLV